MCEYDLVVIKHISCKYFVSKIPSFKECYDDELLDRYLNFQINNNYVYHRLREFVLINGKGGFTVRRINKFTDLEGINEEVKKYISTLMKIHGQDCMI